MRQKTYKDWQREYEVFIANENAKSPTETRMTYSYEQWLVMRAGNAEIIRDNLLGENKRLREASDLIPTYAKLFALVEQGLDYNIYSENTGHHSVELGIWGFEPGMQDKLVLASETTLAGAINEAVRKWENSEWNTFAPIIPCYHCGLIHHHDLPCPGTKRDDE